MKETNGSKGVTVVDDRTVPATDPREQVVAVVLSDGSVYRVADARADARVDAPRSRWSNGTLSGPGWTIWWERRT